MSSIGTATYALGTAVPVAKPDIPARYAPVPVQLAEITLPRPKPWKAQQGKKMESRTALPSLRVTHQPFYKQPSFLEKIFSRPGAGLRLSEEDAARYAHVFAAQDVADFDRADKEIAKLKDTRLMGHVLYQRYMGKGYISRYEELADWLASYSSLPGAQKLYSLAQRKNPAAAAELRRPKSPPRGVGGVHDFDIGQVPPPYLARRKKNKRAYTIIRAVKRSLSNSPTSSLRQLDTDESRELFTKTEYDSLQADIAASYYYNGKLEKAYALATLSAERSGKHLPIAGWIAGLSAWKFGQYAEAARFFEMTATSHRASAWLSSAGAHWAARSHLRARNPKQVSYWLKKSAEHPRTFYGIISLKALGMEQTRFNWHVPELSEKHVKALSASAIGRRALGLVDAERPDLAEVELKHLNPGKNVVLQEAMIALASQRGMPALAMRLGSSFRNKNGEPYDAALYPSAPWMPEKGFEVDKALVYAFIRQESKFDPAAHNRSSGAKGLMQLMPRTARHVARSSGDRVDETKLNDAMVNIDLGQKYLGELLQHDSVSRNLFKLAVAYNAGPGKLSRWQQSVGFDNDPLLFIESIPVAETRIFVERVLTNYWIYRIKFDQSTRSLDHIARGAWPIYAGQDHSRQRSFAAARGFFARP